MNSKYTPLFYACVPSDTLGIGEIKVDSRNRVQIMQLMLIVFHPLQWFPNLIRQEWCSKYVKYFFIRMTMWNDTNWNYYDILNLVKTLRGKKWSCYARPTLRGLRTQLLLELGYYEQIKPSVVILIDRYDRNRNSMEHKQSW